MIEVMILPLPFDNCLLFRVEIGAERDCSNHTTLFAKVRNDLEFLLLASNRNSKGRQHAQKQGHVLSYGSRRHQRQAMTCQ